MGNQASQLGDGPDDNNQRDLHHFDHTFKGEIHTTAGDFFTDIFGELKYDNRPIILNCKGNSMELIEDSGIDLKPKQIEINYLWISGISWDHAASEVKMSITIEETRQEAHVILTMANTIELEGEIKLRFTALYSMNKSVKIPYPMYIGMFAGSTKPKPFQRKRPNLSRLPPAKLPPLDSMRANALSLHQGASKPCQMGDSRRKQIAMQHIHEGCNTFILITATGIPEHIHSISAQAVLVLDKDCIIYKAMGRISDGDAVLTIPFEDIVEWDGVDNENVGQTSGITVRTKAGLELFFGVKFVRDVKHSLEYFWNKYSVANGMEPKPGSTHGRPLVTVTTLSGEVSPPEAPAGSVDVVDRDGCIVRQGAKLANRRRSVIDSMMNSKEDMTTVPPENHFVRKFWHQIVLHQGWLLKKGGVGIGENKAWLKRYFVLYATSQGHFLIYYSDFTECPLYVKRVAMAGGGFSNEQAPRNIVDLSKTTFIRPGSNKAEFSDTPAHSFDIVTTEREWTLCAESQENVQKWLKLLTRAVDEDVAVLPDEELVFKVKPKMDPLSVLNPNDYSTSLKVSANGVSVCSPNPVVGSADHEHYFWAYTDFYKWSLLSQNGKLALLMNVFSDSSFTRRNEYIFRNKEAVRLATAIEFFIEKFMTVMHITLEKGATPEELAGNGTDVAGESGSPLNYAASSEWQHEPEAVDLLDLDVDDADAQASILDMSRTQQRQVQDGIGFTPKNITKEEDNDLLGGNSPSNGSAQEAPTNFGGFSDDPFGMESSGPFGNTGRKEKTAPPLSQEQISQHRIWLQGAVGNSGGPLYDDGTLQVASKIEVIGSQARVTFFYKNKGPSSISQLHIEIQDPAGLIRYQLSTIATDIDPMTDLQNTLMLECMKPASPGPAISITYLDSLHGKRSNTIDLPINTATFNEPLSLGAEIFQQKWDQLTAAGQQKQEVFRPQQAIQPLQVLTGMTRALRFGKVSGLSDETEYVIYGASLLKTGAVGPSGEKISVGCLVKIEMNVQNNAIRLTARTHHPAATNSIFECARGLLS